MSREVGRRYFLIHGLGALAFSVLIYLWLGRSVIDSRSYTWLFVFWAFGAAYCVRPWLPFFAAASVAGLLTVCLNAFRYGPLGVANSLLSTGLLGTSLMAMLLGHWYLTQPKLSITELMRVTWAYLIFLGARLLFATWQVALICSSRSEAEVYRFLMGSSPGIFLLMRIVWGILAPAGLAYFVWKTVKLRSTQSATGILYVVDLAVLTGETVSLYLMLNYGIFA